MRHPDYVLFAAALCLAAACSAPPADQPGAPDQLVPAPTRVAPGTEEGDGVGDARAEWIERMHRAAPGVDWRAVERDNRRAEAARLRRVAPLARRSATAFDSVAPGLLGRWHERGSDNQAGSVLAVAYDAPADELLAVSAGGTLWRGPADGSAWRVVDQDRRYEPLFLGVLPDVPAAGRSRVIAAVDQRPVYSDDGGVTWRDAAGIAPRSSHWSYTWDLAVLTAPDGATRRLLALTSDGYWDPVRLVESTDDGATWRTLRTLDAERRDGADLLAAPDGRRAFVVGDADGALLAVHPDGTVEQAGSLDLGGAAPQRRRLAGGMSGDTLVLYSYDTDDRVWRSADTGATWTARGVLPARPWSVGLHADPTDASRLLSGAVNASHSFDGGRTWVDVNSWADYYGDVEGSLHADMMTFSTFVKTDGTPFTVSANHGGLNVSENWFATSRNVGMRGLNVGQMYSVASHPAHPGYLFAGTQDQGFQRGRGDSTEVIGLEQAISGDYGHLTFSHDGAELWMMYPGTALSVYTDPTRGYYADWLRIDSPDETVWLAPMIANPDTTVDGVLAAGGSSVDGEPGSYLIDFALVNGRIDAVDGDFDFLDQSAGGTLSALGASPLSAGRVYAATSNGRFFASPDGGASWEQSVTFVPEGHYLYGQAILASPVVDSTVWLGGSGYSNPPVWRSDDAGETFVPASAGLPSTLVFELAATPDGSLVFAATEAGPYVLVVAEDRWYPLALDNTPAQTYWSVDYVAADSVVRFGTYGRGIWDLRIREPRVNSSTRDPGAVAGVDLRLYPNPATEFVTVEAERPIATVTIADAAGRVLRRERVGAERARLPVADLAPGLYFVVVRDREGASVASRPLEVR